MTLTASLSYDRGSEQVEDMMGHALRVRRGRDRGSSAVGDSQSFVAWRRAPGLGSTSVGHALVSIPSSFISMACRLSSPR